MARTDLPKLLCVDDHEGVIGGMRITLRRQFVVVAATDGVEALRRLSEESDIAVMVTDMRMPGMNGVEVLRQARQIAPHTRRILLTGYAETELAIAAVNDGAIFRYLTKPCSPPVLRETCLQALSEYESQLSQEHQAAYRVHREIGMIADLAILIRPEAVELSIRTERIASALAKQIAPEKQREISSAAKLFHLGKALLSDEELEFYYARGADSWSHGRGRSQDVDQAAQLVQRIEGADDVVAILRGAARPSEDIDQLGDHELKTSAKIVRGSALVAELEHLGTGPDDVVSAALAVEPALGKILERSLIALVPTVVRESTFKIPIRQLRAGMMVSEDLQTDKGSLLAAAGTVIRTPFLLRIQSMAGPQLPESIRIQTTGTLTSESDQSADLAAAKPLALGKPELGSP